MWRSALGNALSSPAFNFSPNLQLKQKTSPDAFPFQTFCVFGKHFSANLRFNSQRCSTTAIFDEMVFRYHGSSTPYSGCRLTDGHHHAPNNCSDGRARMPKAA